MILQVIPLITEIPTYIELLKDLGVAGLALVVMYYFSKYISNQALEKIEQANINSRESNLRAEKRVEDSSLRAEKRVEDSNKLAIEAGLRAEKRVEDSNKLAIEANRRAEESQEEFKTFLQKEYIENQIVIEKLTNTFKEHIQAKDKALDLVERLIQDKNVPSDYRKYFKK